MSLHEKEVFVNSKERFDALPNAIRKFFRFFYSNEVQLMQFDTIPYFPNQLSFISFVLFADEIDKNRENKEIFLIKTSRDSFSGGYSLSETALNLRSKYEYIDKEQPLLQYLNGNYQVVRILEILTFLRAFERNNLFQMSSSNYSKYGEYSGSYLLFRLSSNFSVGLRSCDDLGEKGVFEEEKIQLNKYFHKILERDYEYLEYWTSRQLRNYCRKNSIPLPGGRRKIDLIKTIQNSKLSKKPRLLFIQNLLRYPTIFQEICVRHAEYFESYYVYAIETEKWSKQKINEFFEKNDSQRTEFMIEYLLENKENDMYLKLLERGLAQKENKIRKDVKRLFQESYKLIFPEPIKPRKIEKSKLYSSKISKFAQVKIKTDDFRVTRNIGQRGECYICYNVLLSDLEKKYPQGKVINNEWENGFYIEIDGEEIARVIWNNEIEESFEPYDLLLMDNNEEFFVEVKASINNYIDFTISKKELDFAKEKEENYVLYQVVNVNNDNIGSYKFEDFYKKYQEGKFEIDSYKIKYREL